MLSQSKLNQVDDGSIPLSYLHEQPLESGDMQYQEKYREAGNTYF
jgi:hypothetical protein